MGPLADLPWEYIPKTAFFIWMYYNNTMNEFSKIYMKSTDAILDAIREISDKPFDLDLINKFSEAEYHLFESFHYKRDVLDLSGIGGSLYNTANVGTISAFIIASLGIPVVKLSFPSYSGSVGSADVLNSYGIPIRMEREEIKKDLDRFNLSFIQRKYTKEGLVRNEKLKKIALKMPKYSVFRVLGLLCHPMEPKYRIYGLSKDEYAQSISSYLSKNTSHYMVVYGTSGLDEVDISKETKIWEDQNNYIFKPEDIGMARREIRDITTDKKENISLLEAVLSGKAHQPIVELVLINAAATIKIYKTMSWIESYDLAKMELKSKRPLGLLGKIKQAL
ncbi:hypothetical protein COY62_02380 [bacterium (Candidatus Howlettbacteria) CG_4_10_14_0_8_um_filter_40_9]|nr:MAG: hypothetical protein COY62_02380 [bacterium (Candidatus Howlettbacteria) CG_4_10_14_0_8_um_filter_40_9]